MKELELYVHIPFCAQKCAYCDFLSGPAKSEVRIAYIQKLREEIRRRSERFREREVVSVFFGGGTPSILHGQQILDLMNALRREFRIVPEAEITVECNPGTVSAEKLRTYRRAGINRLSFGLQSADDEELRLLGRIHTYRDFLESFDLARKHGFQNINVDLMSALPGQTTASWERTLKKTVLLKPEHISAYSLIIEEGTPFYQRYHADDARRSQGGQPQYLPSEEEERAMYRLTRAYLGEKGYERYEISNYAKPGKACRHNIGYWNRTDYLGLGVGAASLVDNRRFSNAGLLADYLSWDLTDHDAVKLSKREQMEEFLFLGLRMMRGISRAEFLRQFSVSLDSVYAGVLETLKGQGLLTESGGRIQLTEDGIDVGNYVFSQFLLEDEE